MTGDPRAAAPRKPAPDGLQPERTELAWRRTALSMAAFSLVGARLLPALFGDARWLLPGAAGAVLAGWLWLASRGRHLRYPRTSGPSPAPAPPGSPPFGPASTGAGLLALAGGMVVALGLGGLAVVVHLLR
ncbi:DUF202 domain-containing protein [Promicromonospora thailandica]|uniref:Membrane protein n=1 Tax=Promicromonospora thailandica TaxID=765201 RepID=A0A9X2JWU6_9MICO|nr:DUF202 domain-containing protein [Promicromonospora thailandica]MCP2266985.1 putative membrane protein [Promicromonospora thailandica]BFF16740.1 hypothetical protein GCM10025730_02610 [Promicromonospora thailandica]